MTPLIAPPAERLRQGQGNPLNAYLKRATPIDNQHYDCIIKVKFPTCNLAIRFCILLPKFVKSRTRFKC